MPFAIAAVPPGQQPAGREGVRLPSPLGVAAEDREATVADWAQLTSLNEKRRYYSAETYFRESMWDAKAILGPRLFSVLHRITLLIFKPESLAGRRVGAVMRFLAQHEFTPIHFLPFTYTRATMREVWRYQWNAATIDKMDVADRVNGRRPTAMVILRDDAAPRELPAAVRLKQLKGAASPEVREQETLRAAIGAPNRLITFVHTPDEPADLVRELGIFFDREGRRSLFTSILGSLEDDVTDEVVRVLERLQSEAQATDFDPEAAWRRILARADGQTRTALLGQRELFRESGKVDWEAFSAVAAAVGAEDWDVLAIGTAAVEYDDAGQEPFLTFDERGIDGWLGGKARLCLDERSGGQHP